MQPFGQNDVFFKDQDPDHVASVFLTYTIFYQKITMSFIESSRYASAGLMLIIKNFCSNKFSAKKYGRKTVGYDTYHKKASFNL